MDIRHRLLITVLATSLSLFSAACAAEGEGGEGNVEGQIEGEEDEGGGLYGD